MQGSFTSDGIAFEWTVQRGPGSPLSWMLVVVAGDISIARRYETSLTWSKAENEALKVAPMMVTVIEQWTG
jgi:hypothetical protein